LRKNLFINKFISFMNKLHAVVLGATGATGKELVSLLLKNTNFYKVSVFVRRPIIVNHPKLTIHQIDFSKLSDYKNLIFGDMLFSSLGTTRSDAGSKRKQYIVDYTYQYEFAKIASDNNIGFYSLVSSIGANNKSFFFYPKIKGELEEAVKKLNFKRIHIFQPPSLIRQPDLIRKGESLALCILRKINSIGLLKAFTPLPVKDVAEKMVVESLKVQSDKIYIYKLKKLYNY